MYKSVYNTFYKTTVDKKLNDVSKENKLILGQHKKRKNIEEFFSNFDGDYISAEVDWGDPVGREAL